MLTKQSHNNYYVVRKRWIELLRVVNGSGNLSRTLINTITGDNYLEEIFGDVKSKVKEYTFELRKKSDFINQKKTFIAIYQKLMSKCEDKSNFVNLYDICKEMNMGYDRFQIFLTNFYQEEKLVRNIFLSTSYPRLSKKKAFI